MRFDLSRALEGKAVPMHPVWMDRTTPVVNYAPGAGNTASEDTLISQQNAARHMEAYGGPQAIDWVYDCIGLYSDPVATAPYRLERKDGTKLVRERTTGTPPDHEVGPADLYRLLDEPNDLMSYDELMSLLVIDLLMVGNAYWFKWRSVDGRPMALYRMAPSHVKVKPGPFGPKRYEYQPPGAREPMKIEPENVIHFRRPNPHSAYYGMGIIQGGGRSFDLELAITDTMAHYYENRADPSLIVQSERRVPKDVMAKMRAMLRARAGGPHNAGDILLLEAGLKASSLDRSASDNLFEALSKMSRDRVYAKFRANPMLFGLMDETAGSNKVSDARREFDSATLQPFMTRLQRQITRALTAAWGVNYYIDYDMLVPVEEALKIAESVSNMPGVKMREIRRQYRQFGIEESTGDPELDELVLNVPMEEMDEDGQGGAADRPIGSEPGRPPLGKNTTAFARVRAAAAEGKALTQGDLDADLRDLATSNRTPLTGYRYPGRKALPAPVTIDGALRQLEAMTVIEGKAVASTNDDRVTIGNKLPDEQRPQDHGASARTREIDATQAYMTTQLRDAAADLEASLVREVGSDGKALKTSNIVARLKGSSAWKTFQERVETILLEGARRSASTAVIQSGLDPEDEIDYDTIAKEVVYRPDGANKIVRTLRDRVVNRIKEVRDGNGEREDFERAIRATAADWADAQAVTVADSEATEAYNEGTLVAAEASGIQRVFVVEEGDAPDEACQEADGQVWDIATARSRRKEHPRCRRAFLPLAPVES